MGWWSGTEIWTLKKSSDAYEAAEAQNKRQNWSKQEAETGPARCQVRQSNGQNVQTKGQNGQTNGQKDRTKSQNGQTKGQNGRNGQAKGQKDQNDQTKGEK